MQQRTAVVEGRTLTPALTDIEDFARDERTISEAVESLMSEYSRNSWWRPDFEARLQRILRDERLIAKRLVGADGHLELSSVFPPEDSDIAARIEQAASPGYGLIVVASPTGGGKTTTLTAIARLLASTDRIVGRLADTFEILVRRRPEILISDYPGHDELFPRFFKDVIIPDECEIRDTETALEALGASKANTVLATMHGRSATQIPKRLVWTATASGIEVEDLDSSIASSTARSGIRQIILHRRQPLRLFVVCQQRVRRLCASCSSDGEPLGCTECRRGYRGFAAVAETLDVEVQTIAGLSSQDFSTHEKYRPFDEHAAALVANKVTTQDEILRVLGREADTGLVARGAAVAGGAAGPPPET